MIELIIAILLGLATPAAVNTTTDSSQYTTEADDTYHCPYNVEDCACYEEGYTGGDNGHIPIPPR